MLRMLFTMSLTLSIPFATYGADFNAILKGKYQGKLSDKQAALVIQSILEAQRKFEATPSKDNRNHRDTLALCFTHAYNNMTAKQQAESAKLSFDDGLTFITAVSSIADKLNSPMFFTKNACAEALPNAHLFE